MDDWIVGYPINFTAQGDLTKDAIQRACIQEIAKIYAHLNLLGSKFEADASIKVVGELTSLADLPTTGTTGDVYQVSLDDGNWLYSWIDGQWQPLTTAPFPSATDTEYGLVRKGTIQHMLDKVSSNVAVVTETLLREFGYEIGFDVPGGTVVPWWGSRASMPTGWALCDGTSGTPNLVNKFARGAENGELLNEGGADEHVIDNSPLLAHTHPITAQEGAYEHTHRFRLDLKPTTYEHMHHARFTTMNCLPSSPHSHPMIAPAGFATALLWDMSTAHNTITPTTDNNTMYTNGPSLSHSHSNTASNHISLNTSTQSHAHNVSGQIAESEDYTTSITGITEPAVKTDPKTIANIPAYLELLYIMKL
jgi:hypothetical protein